MSRFIIFVFVNRCHATFSYHPNNDYDVVIRPHDEPKLGSARAIRIHLETGLTCNDNDNNDNDKNNNNTNFYTGIDTSTCNAVINVCPD